ncbi:MAG: hypothetical protein IPP14_11825 [Planctomycetes bacterium]|nr:hypothetical protein [Planctomycetota bacterium]
MRPLFASLCLLLLPALHAGLLERYAPTYAGKEKDLKKSFDGELVNWVQTECANKTFPRTWLTTSTGPAPFLVVGATSSAVTMRQLLQTGEVDEQGVPQQVPAADSSQLKWDLWAPKYLLGTFPLEGNKDDAQLARFAIWLNERREPELANRVLTVMYKRVDAEAQADIAAWVRANEKVAADAPMVVALVYDAEFRMQREMLLAEKLADKIIKDRESAARAELSRLKTAVAKRSETLAMLEYQIRQFERGFAQTDTLAKSEKDRAVMRQAIDDGSKRIAAQVKQAESFNGEFDKQAACWEKAAEDDPCNCQYRSTAASLWMRYANLYVRSKKQLECTHEDGMKKCRALYETLVKEFPANAGILLGHAKCLHFYEKYEDAKAFYKKVIQYDTDGAQGRFGREAEQRVQNL